MDERSPVRQVIVGFPTVIVQHDAFAQTARSQLIAIDLAARSRAGKRRFDRRRGLPLVEAMHHRVPVVARDAAAVGETVGQAGLVVGELPLPRLAELVALAAEDGPLRERLVAAGQARVGDFAPARVADRPAFECSSGTDDL